MIELAKKEMERFFVQLPDADLAYLPRGTEHFYMRAVSWAQKFARANRRLMMDGVLAAFSQFFPDIETDEIAVNCHHTCVDTEEHFGETVLVTRKGAVRARAGDLGIIPGSWAPGRSSSAARAIPRASDPALMGRGVS